jgi:hypothetical protein
MHLKIDTIKGAFGKQQLQNNVATKTKIFGRFPPVINVIPKTTCSAVSRIIVRYIHVDCTAANIQCV